MKNISIYKSVILRRLGTLRSLFMFFICAILSACAGYQAKTQNTVQAMRAGSIDSAMADLEKNNTSKERDLLYFLEKGELLRLKGDLAASRDTWMSADKIVQQWEGLVKTDPSKLMGDVGSVLLNDTTRRYDGRDYEKVILNLRLALNHLQMGNWDAARTEIKKMHEREAIIAEFRSREIDSAKQSAEQKGLSVTSFKDLKGYPVETLEAPEVVELKNSYESAVANYVAGFIYESLGEPSLASAGYRKAVEMRAGNAVLEESLAGLDARISSRGRRVGIVDTLVVVESGNAPSIESMTIPIMLPIPSKNGISIVATPLSWPVVKSDDGQEMVNGLQINGQSAPMAFLTSVDQMARRSIRDEMPGVIVRSSIRAIMRGAAQKAIDDNSGNAGAAGALVSLFAKVAAVATEVADERGWRTIPGKFYIARVSLPQGKNDFVVTTQSGTKAVSADLSGPYAVVSIRVQSGAVYLAKTPYSPEAAVLVPEPPKPVVSETPISEKKTKKKSPNKSIKSIPTTVGAATTSTPVKGKSGESAITQSAATTKVR